MTIQDFKALIGEKVVILDGATGSNLQQRGMPTGVSPEKWILENPEVFIGLQMEYLEAGSDILLAPTFTSNRIKLAEYGLQEQIAQINHALVKLSKSAVQRYREKTGCTRDIYIAADISMTGEQVYPLGTLTFEELVNVYKEQIGYCLEAGVDLVAVETMMSLQECRAALLAVKETCELPVMVSLTFEENGRTLYGTDPKTAVIVLQSMGADAIGMNCSTGPEGMINVLHQMKAYAHVPILVKPNAGIPKLVDGKTIFPMKAYEFADAMEQMVLQGANLVGGCCGTTPEHIRQMVDKVKDIKPQSPNGKVIGAVTTERNTVEIPLDGHFIVIGERINPTGKKAMQEELRVGDLTIVSQMAKEQTELGAQILDINVGMNGINEKETMIEVLYQVLQITEAPLSIDTSNPEVMEAALRIYPGRALINSISYKEDQYEKLLALAKKYGAMFILLPLSDKGMPKDLDEKKQIIHTILDAAFAQGLSREDIIVDGLVTTLGADPNAARDALSTIRYCKETLGMATVCGLSNISFGMPERQFINSTFLAFAIQAGLTMAIANPSQELIMNTALASDLICAKEASADRYVNSVRAVQMTKGENKSTNSSNSAGVSNGIQSTTQDKKSDLPQEVKEHPIFDAVVKGNKKSIETLLKNELEKGVKPEKILDTILIPAITEVGRLYDRQIYFLPQLIAGAKVMEDAVAYLEPLLQSNQQNSNKGTIVIATVAGDIHDIGKNLVSLMLKNFGYNVIDLGKDVATDDIIAKAKEVDADFIAVSALMTTTMTEMERIVKKVRSEGLRTKVIIGGAAVTESYRIEIGADGYSEDAQSAVKLVNRLMGQKQ